jgi:hypothetical protein
VRHGLALGRIQAFEEVFCQDRNPLLQLVQQKNNLVGRATQYNGS